MPKKADRRKKQKFEYTVRVLNRFRKPVRSLLEANGIPKREHDYYWLMLHWVTKGMLKAYKDTYMVTKKPPKFREWFCRLYSRIMNDAMGHKYIEVLNNLVKWGVLVRGGSYCKGGDGLPGKCKAVWFTEEYGLALKEYCFFKDVVHLFGKIESEPEPDYDLMTTKEAEEERKKRNARKFRYGTMYSSKLTSRVLLKRLEKCAEERKKVQLDDPVVRDAHDNVKHFHIDRGRARRALEKDGVKGKNLDRELKKVDRFNDTGSKTSLFVVRDDYGRVHTNVTQMKKCVRQHAMDCDGKPVGSVDIKSSQGAFLGYILEACLRGDRCVLGRNRESFIDMEAGVPDGIGREALTREYMEYRKLLEGRGLYEFFAREMSEDCDLEIELDEAGSKPIDWENDGREVAKKAFLSTLFAGIELGENANPTWKACRRVWEERWPRLLQLVNWLKRDNYRAMAYELQRMESTFVFDHVVPRIREEIGCPYCTVHDEIIVPAEHVASVEEIMHVELGRFGIPTTTGAEGGLLEPTDAQWDAETNSCYEAMIQIQGWGDRADNRVTDEFAMAM